MTFQNLVKMAWTVATTLVIFLLTEANAQDYTKTECLSGKEESTVRTIQVNCPTGMQISIDEAIFGRNKWGSCTHTIGDCTDKIDLFQSCQGKDICSVQLDKTYSPKCGYATFLRVLYDCVSAAIVVTESIETPRVTVPHTRVWSPPIAIRDDTPSINPDQVSNSEEAGLIAGCVVAVIVTTIMLLFAIFLVVKRLFKSPPSDAEKGPDGNPIKPNIVIFDFCFCGPSAPEKQRPVADQNQNTQRAPPLRISDRPVPIGEVAVSNVTEFRHDGEVSTPVPVTTQMVVDSTSSSVLTEPRVQRSSRGHPQQISSQSNTAVGLPNTNSSTLC